MISLETLDIKQAKLFHIEIVNKIFDDIIDKGYILRGASKEKKYLPKCFLRFVSTNQEILVSGEPLKLLKVHNEFQLLGLINEDKVNVLSFLKETGYKSFQNNYGKEFLNLLGIDTCIYCNKNYTLYYGGNHARAQLDHWFPKDKFPILALSFYNLIPSCQSCNHIKSNNSPLEGWDKALENLNHPYFKQDSIFNFSYFFKDDINSYKVVINSIPKSKTEKTLEFNKTKDIYNANSDKELKDLLDLRYKYSDNYIDILINKTFEGIMSKEEIYRMIFGIEIKEEDYHKRPFSKFKHDIIEELKKIK